MIVTLPEPSLVLLVGASGSGKSTVIRLLLREDRPTSGRIVVAGRDLTRIKRREVPRLRRDLGVVFQDFRLLPDKTVAENVAYVLHVLGARRDTVREQVPATLEVVGLSSLARRFPHELSGGEQQRVAIARALVKKPRLLLADEPTGNLDPGTSLEIVRLLSQINEAGTTVLMATHDDSIVNEIRRRVIELSNGRIVRDEQDGAYEAPRPEIAERAGGGSGAAVAAASGAAAWQGHPPTTRVPAAAPAAQTDPVAAADLDEPEPADDEPRDWPFVPRRSPAPSRRRDTTTPAAGTPTETETTTTESDAASDAAAGRRAGRTGATATARPTRPTRKRRSRRERAAEAPERAAGQSPPPDPEPATPGPNGSERRPRPAVAKVRS